MKNILLIDDHPIFRAGLVAALRDSGEYGSIGETGSLREARVALRDGKWDIILLDLNLPDGSGLDLLEPLQALSPPPKTLILSMHAERDFVDKAMRLGASGYATKNLPFATLSLGLRLIAAGEIFIEAELLRDLLSPQAGVSSVDPDAQQTIAGLSAREREILEQLLSGATIKEAASRLAISVRTAENYQSNLYAKLNAHSPIHLVVTALRGGMQPTISQGD